jgi:hypothetical protein
MRKRVRHYNPVPFLNAQAPFHLDAAESTPIGGLRHSGPLTYTFDGEPPTPVLSSLQQFPPFYRLLADLAASCLISTHVAHVISPSSGNVSL